MTASPGTTPSTPGAPTPECLQAVPSVPWRALSPPRTPALGSCSLPACCRVVLEPAGAPSAHWSSLRDAGCGPLREGPCPSGGWPRRGGFSALLAAFPSVVCRGRARAREAAWADGGGPALTLAHAWRLSSHASVHDSVFDRQIDLSPCHGDMLGWLIGSCAIDTWLYENRTKHP